MTDKETMKLALEALEVCERSDYGRNWVWPDTAHPTAMANVREAITAIKEALAQPAPVQDSICNETLRGQGKAYPRTCKKCGLGPCIGKPKFDTTPPQRTWVYLTDEEVRQTWHEGKDHLGIAKVLQDKFRSKNEHLLK